MTEKEKKIIQPIYNFLMYCRGFEERKFTDRELWEAMENTYDLIKKQQKEIKDYTKFKKAIVNRIMMWDKKELPDNEEIISVLDTIMSEVSRLEDIEDRKIQVAVKFIEEKRDKYWEKKIEEKIKELEETIKKKRQLNIKEWVGFEENEIEILEELLKEKK